MEANPEFGGGSPSNDVAAFITRIEEADPNSASLSEDDMGVSWGHYQFSAGALTCSSVLKSWASVGNNMTACRLIAAAVKTCKVARHVCGQQSILPTSYLADSYLERVIDLLWAAWDKAGGVSLSLLMTSCFVLLTLVPQRWCQKILSRRFLQCSYHHHPHPYLHRHHCQPHFLHLTPPLTKIRPSRPSQNSWGLFCKQGIPIRQTASLVHHPQCSTSPMVLQRFRNLPYPPPIPWSQRPKPRFSLPHYRNRHGWCRHVSTTLCRTLWFSERLEKEYARSTAQLPSTWKKLSWYAIHYGPIFNVLTDRF